MTDTKLKALRSETTKVLDSLGIRGTRVALLDFPNHKNAGDHLIFFGEIQYLRQLNADLTYIADASRYDRDDMDRVLGDGGVILIHGGGNFGDRWTESQQFHEKIVRENTHRKIIQLSQGIEFTEGGSALLRAQDIYSQHPNLTLLIRDRESFTTTQRLFSANHIIYCPDMAFGFDYIGSGARLQKAKFDVVYLKRTDSESTDSRPFEFQDEASVIIVDWHLSAWGEIAWFFLHIPGGLARRIPHARRLLYPVLRRCYRLIAALNLRSAARILSLGRIVVTDRLHAAVLATLAGKQVIAIDNANGKVSAIYRDYLHRFGSVHMASSIGDAELALGRLLE